MEPKDVGNDKVVANLYRYTLQLKYVTVLMAGSN